MKKLYWFLILFNLITFSAISQTKLGKIVLSNGGQVITNTSYRINLSLGQAVAAKTVSLDQEACIGFWYRLKETGDKTLKIEKYSKSDRVITRPFNRTSQLKIYPNPFFDRAQIEFELAEQGRARLILIDLQGKQVDVLMDENMPEGIFKIAYDARPGMSGVYTLILTTGSERLHQSCIVMK